MRTKLIHMIHTLHEQGRDDLVNGIARGTLKALQVFNRFKFNRLSELPHADELPLLRETWRNWLEKLDCSDDHRYNTRLYFERLEKLVPEHATIGHIVDALKLYRDQVRAHPRTFNLAKSNGLAFLRDTLTRRHRYYHEVQDIPTMRIRDRRSKHPLTPDQLRDLVRKLGEPWGPMAWTMATTGMHWKEYVGRWQREGDGLRIHGTKVTSEQRSEGYRDRLIPVVSLLHRPIGTIYAFRWHLNQVTPRVTPYDLRRTFTSLMTDARIPRPRVELYLGHSAKDITALYEWQEVREYLTKDAEAMRTVLGDPPEGPMLRVVTG